MGKVKVAMSLSEWEINAMNHQLLGSVEDLEGGGKKPNCLHKERNSQAAFIESHPPLIFCGISTGLALVNMFKHTYFQG